VSEFISLLPINSAPLWSLPRMIHILNWHEPGSASVHNSVTLIVCCEVILLTKIQIQKPKINTFLSVRNPVNQKKAEIETENK